jgi:hypothetical protein
MASELCPRATDVEERLHRQYGIDRNIADPALLPRLLKVFGKVSALECLGVLTLPDVRVAMRSQRSV